jgi:glutamine synthetase
MEELATFLEAHPDVQFVDVLLPDLCNVIRGKRLPRADLEKFFREGFQVPSSIMLLDVTGEGGDPGGRGFSDGDPDVCARPVPGTLQRVPWFDEPLGQVLGTLYDLDGSPCSVDPRHILSSVCKRLTDEELFPVVALELEFYLIDPNLVETGKIQPPLLPTTGRRVQDTQVYSISDLEGFSKFLSDVSQICDTQNIRLGAASTEYAQGQYEINLHHVTDVQLAADHAILLQRVVRGTARQHGTAATFMAKPYREDAGSGLHVHLSLADKKGDNLFDDGTEAGTIALRHAVGGLLKTMPEAMALFAPNVNSYRRFVPNLYVPTRRSWGYNNRSVAVRIPGGGSSSRRLEHRVAGADANPYLVLAAVLAGVHHGIQHRLDPGEASVGNVCGERDPDLSFSWQAALDASAAGQVLPEYLGTDYLDLYRQTKQFELDNYNDQFSPLEFDWYLNLG